MGEYCIYVGLDEQKKVPSDWRDKIITHHGVSLHGEDERGIVVKCNDETAERLIKKFRYLKIEFVMPYDNEEEKEE